MRAFVHKAKLTYVTDMPQPKLGDDEVRVQLVTAGLNRRDLYIPDRRGDVNDPLIIGSDGAGIIKELGKNVEGWDVGDEVIINPSLRWKESTLVPPSDFDILGMPDHGTFAEQITINADQLEKKPNNYSWEEAGVLGLAALTAYRALFTQGQLQKGQTVFIPGGSSGVATYLIQYAVAVGARVIVTSRSVYKREKSKEIGAHVVLDTNDDWEEKLVDETIDLVIESVGAATFQKSLDVLKLGGRIVVFGATAGDTVELDLRSFFYGQYTLIGSTMGSREEFQSMLVFITEHNIHPVLDTMYSLERSQEAHNRLFENKHFGKIGLHISKES
ncbi:MAG TPA: zinc-binding dehydrogenase [Bacillota bacterium]|nr:zinc-binding dehydrogenase [Bacillota bacterium]